LGAAWLRGRRRNRRDDRSTDASGTVLLERMVASIEREREAAEAPLSERDWPPESDEMTTAPARTPAATVGVGLLGLLIVVLMITLGAGGPRRR